MVHIAFHFRDAGKKEILPARSLKEAKRLFRYAVSCATADLRIELVVGGQIVKTHWVNFVETIPTVTEVRLAGAKAAA